MLFLIDGYNLLFAEGMIRGRAGPTGLEKARLGLLGMLKGAFGDEAGKVTVVFDAAKAPPGLEPEQDYHGIHVLFAKPGEQADDLIERLILHDSAPRQVSVVSNYHRIQQAARHRHCEVMSCGDFLDLVERRRRQRPPARPQSESGKPESVSRGETQHWLREFGGLDNDPDFKAAFDPFDFEEKPGS